MDSRIPITEVSEVPADPGIYVVYSDTRVGWLAWSPAAGAAYVGKADDGLRRRIDREHNGDTGRSTLRRTLGALLKAELGLVARPRPSKGPPKAINFTNYSFEPDGDERLTSWMGDHLSVEWRVTNEPRSIEDDLIRQYQPPLNLTGWANPVAAAIKAARKSCADEARSSGTG